MGFSERKGALLRGLQPQGENHRPVVDEALVKEVIDDDPDGSFVETPVNGNGELLLHLAVRYNWSNDILLYILQAYPAGTMKRDYLGGWTPLHTACATRFHYRGVGMWTCVRLLLRHGPEAAREQDLQGNLPLHLCMQLQPFVLGAPAIAIFDAFPAAIVARNKEGKTPLHEAADRGMWFRDVNCMRHFLDRFPDAAMERDSKGNLPLHVCVGIERSNPSASAVAILPWIEAYPDGLFIQNQIGQTPLHVACQKGGLTQDVIGLLLERGSDAGKIRDEKENLPLHLAVSGSPSCHIKLLFDAAFAQQSEGDCLLLAQNHLGWTPLHIACRKGVLADADACILLQLIKRCPEAVRTGDKKGNLPLHLAVSGCHPSHVRQLVAAFPKGCQARNSAGRLPMDILVESVTTTYSRKSDRLDRKEASRMTITMQLVRKYPECLSLSNAGGQLVLHKLCSCTVVDCLPILKPVLKANPSACLVADEQGRLPLHVLCQTLNVINSAGFNALQTVRFLVKQCPESVLVQDYKGNIPLVYCCENNVAPSIIMLLTEYSLCLFDRAH